VHLQPVDAVVAVDVAEHLEPAVPQQRPPVAVVRQRVPYR
jgi:hypothetical protein